MRVADDFVEIARRRQEIAAGPGHQLASVPLTRAAVSPYLGYEIPEWDRLDLVFNRLYRLLRAPEELARAAPTFSHLPVARRHCYVGQVFAQPELIVGTTGVARWESPFVVASLVLFRDVSPRHLSAAYRYRADMTPGVYNGEPYDGVMRDIRGDHIALHEARPGAEAGTACKVTSCM
jgi:uncharacterized protein